MHEYGLVQALIARASEEATARDAIRVKRLTVSLGELSGVEPELFTLAWETFRERTVCDGAELIVQRVPARWECPSCGSTLERGAWLRCCGVPARLAAGDDLILERLELEVPDV